MNQLPVSLRVCAAIFFVLPAAFSAAQDAKPPQEKPAASSTAEFRAEPSAQRLARGKYLVENVAHCFECHGDSDFGKGLGQPKPGTEGAGQVITDEDNDPKLFPDGIVIPNITPDKETGAGNWTDAQFERGIRQGIGYDGRILFNMMPYSYLRSMTDEDVASVIVYLRSLPPVKNPLPKMRLGFERKLDMEPAMEPVLAPDATEQVRHGWYLVRRGAVQRLPHALR